MNEDDIIIEPTPLAASETSEIVSTDYTSLISDINTKQDLLISLDFMQLFSLWVIVGVLLMILFRGR